MKAEGFNETDIQYALQNIATIVDNKIYVNPADFVGLTKEEKLQKLLLLGLSEESAKDALVFLSDIEQ